jgi:hypothetical protein
MESEEAAESRARVPLRLVVLVVVVLLIVAGVLVAHPFVGGRSADPAQPDKLAANTSDNRLTDAMTGTARIFWVAHDMHAVTLHRLQDAVNGVPGANDAPGSHRRPVKIVPAPDPDPHALAFNVESKEHIVFIVFEAQHWMCLAYDPVVTDTISIGTGPTPESISTYTKCHKAAETET